RHHGGHGGHGGKIQTFPPRPQCPPWWRVQFPRATLQKSTLNPNCCCRFGNSAAGVPNADDWRLAWKFVKLSVSNRLKTSQKPVATRRPPNLNALLTRKFAIL